MRAVFPYRRAADSVRVDAWLLVDDAGVREAPPYLDAWDYNTELHLRRATEIDAPALRREACLPEAARLELVVTAFSTLTWLRHRVFSAVIEGSGGTTIELSLGGSDLGGSLRLHTGVLLAEPLPAQTFTAQFAGSMLWDDHFEIRLQGDAPLFPISVVNFDAAGFPTGAGWHLEIGSDLDLPLHASLRLYINRGQPTVVGAFSRAAAPNAEDVPVLRAVYADVARVMVEHALTQEGLRNGGEWESDSLGFALGRLLERYFPGADLGAILDQRIEHPSAFSTELFARLRVFDD